MKTPTEAQTRQWLDDGYLVFEHAIQGAELKRMQTAFDRWAEACKEDWMAAIDRGESAATFFDIPNPLEKETLFIDLIDHPSYYGCLKAFTEDELILLGPQFRTVPPWPLSYTGWHPDVPHDNPLHIKVQIYVNDVEPGAGEFAYIPGSHKPDAGPYARVRELDAMPGHKRFPGKAGTAIMFNSYGWHVAMDNHTGVPRKSIILIYEKHTPDRVKPEAFASIAEHLNTHERRRLFSREV